MKWLWLLAYFWSSLCSAKLHYNHFNRTDIYFAAFFPMTPVHSREGLIGHGVMPAVRLAIKHINQSPNILKGYKLHMYWNDTQCNPGVGLKAFFDMVHLSPKKLILFGAACSPVTDQIAKAASHWNLVQLTYADTHPMFTNKVFPNFYRVVPSENEFNPPRLSILRYFNWTRVGTLYQNSAKYALAHNNLVSELEGNNFTVVASQSFNDEITNQLDILIDKDSRIILGNFNESWARKIFCDAYKKGVHGPKFQWIIVGMYEDEWWLKGLDDTECTAAEMAHALVGVMVMDIQALASREEITVSGRMPVEYEKQYTNMTRHYSRYHGYAYDGVWAAALAIEEVGRKMQAYNNNLTLADFSYRDKTWEQAFIHALDKTSFEGVTGPVRFKDNSRRGNIVIQQIVREEEGDDATSERIRQQCIGEYSGVTRTLYLERCGPVFWSGDRPPRDRTITRIVPNRVNITIYSALCIVASLGIVLAFSFLIVNIKYRRQKQIKMSSPNMNNLIIVGCILTYTSVIILGLDSYMTSEDSFPYICTARAWILMTGFTLSFGSMFSKTWRVHSIFTNVQLNKKVMKDSQLYLVVGLMICIDVVTMTAWQIMDPFYRETKELEPYTDEHDDGVQIIPKLEYCRSNHLNIFVGCIYAYKGLLMLFGAFLAWETRQVQIPALNDSKYVGMSLYNVGIMCVLGVAVNFVLQDHQNASFIIISIFIIFCTTGTLCLVFVPKIIDLKRDPYGTLDKRGKPTIKTFGNVPKNPLQTMEDKLRIANKVSKKYKELMNELDENIKQVMEEIGNDEEANLLLAKGHPQPQPEKTHVSFAIDVTDMSSSSYSEKTSATAANTTATTVVMVSQNGGGGNSKVVAKLPAVSASSQAQQALPVSTIVVNNEPNVNRSSATSTITSDYFSMNSEKKQNSATMMPTRIITPIEQPHHHPLPPPPDNSQVDLRIAASSVGLNGTAAAAVPSRTTVPNCCSLEEYLPLPPPPPQYDTKESELCRKLSCSAHTCNSQEDSLNSAYTDEDDEEEGEDEGEEDEEGYYQLRKPNQDCHSLAIESHSCQTYEDHATQTEDEEDEEDERDISEEEALPYHQDYNEASSRRRSEDFSPTGTKEEWELNKANSLRFRSSRSSHHHPKAKHNSAHHHKHHAHHVMKAEQLHVSAGSSISNQNIHNVDSIEILPIFHKLLEDKRSSDCAFNNSATQDHSHYHHHVTPSAASSSDHPDSKNRFHSARSCPDMSVRCDIVEYL